MYSQLNSLTTELSRVSLNALSLYIINSESHPMAGVMHFTASILITKQTFRLPSIAWCNRDIFKQKYQFLDYKEKYVCSLYDRRTVNTWAIIFQIVNY